MLSEASGGEIEVTLIDKGDAFVFGFSKLDLMFGREQPEAIRMAYADIAKPGLRVLRETVMEINPETRRVTTDVGVHEADALVVALGADYDFEATPGLLEGGNEFYSVAGAERLAEIIPTFSAGTRGDRCRRRAVQVSAGAERVRAAARRGAALARRARCLPDLLRDPVADAGAALAGGLCGAGSRVRRSAASS